jgi:hypothetical protein
MYILQLQPCTVAAMACPQHGIASGFMFALPLLLLLFLIVLQGEKKKKKKNDKAAVAEQQNGVPAAAAAAEEVTEKKKKKKRAAEDESAAAGADATAGEKKVKKAKKAAADGTEDGEKVRTRQAEGPHGAEGRCRQGFPYDCGLGGGFHLFRNVCLQGIRMIFLLCYRCMSNIIDAF